MEFTPTRTELALLLQDKFCKLCTEGGVDMPMTINQFRQLAAYNRWANARLYAAALDLSNQAYRLHIGVLCVPKTISEFIER
jgi:hypothetical protein